MADQQQAPIFTPFQPSTPMPEAQAESTQTKPSKLRRKRKVTAVNPPAEPKAKRAPRTPKGMKLSVGTAIAIMAELKSDDGPLFEKLLGIINAAGAGQRKRVLAALGKVFA